MKRDEFMDQVAQRIAEYTILTVPDMEDPFQWKLEDKTSVKQPSARKYEKNVRTSSQYNIRKDKRVMFQFSAAAEDTPFLKWRLGNLSLTLVSNLCELSINMPTPEQLGQMLKVADYSPEEMNMFVICLLPSQRSCFRSSDLLSVGALLHRTLWDCLCEGVGMEGWTNPTKEELAGEGKRSSKKKKINPQSPAPCKRRLLALVDYMQENQILILDSLHLGDYEVGEQPPITEETVQNKRIEAQREYENYILKYAELECKKTIILSECTELERRVERESQRIADTAIQLQKKKIQEMRKKKVATPHQKSGQLLKRNPTSEPMRFSIPSEVSFEPTNPLSMALQATTEEDQLIKRVKTALYALSDYQDAVQEQAMKELDELHKKQAEYMKVDYAPDIAESAFLAILMEDEVYKLEICSFIWDILAWESCIPQTGALVPDLEDEPEWDDLAYPGENPGLETMLLWNEDIAWMEESGGGERGVNIPLNIGAAIAEYAERKIELPFSIRRSHVKAFKKMGLSDRKSRDYAVMVAALQMVNRMEEGIFNRTKVDYYPQKDVPEIQDLPVEEAVAAIQKECDEARRMKKAAEHESKRLRHDMAVQQREMEQLRAEIRRCKEREIELQEQIRKRDELYEQEEETGEGVEIDFPYHTEQKVVLYGGFSSFHQEMKRLIPNLRIIPHAAHLDLQPFRNADIIFLQINKTSHSNYWNVCDTAKGSGVPYYHLNNAGPRACAAVMVKKLQNLEKRNRKHWSGN